jgi:molecular chaperone GrpE
LAKKLTGDNHIELEKFLKNLENFIAVDKKEIMNQEELTQDVQEETQNNITSETEMEQKEEKPKGDKGIFKEMFQQFVDGTKKNKEEGSEEAAEAVVPSESELLAAAAEQLKLEKSELNDKYLRLFAEFQNYKRRTAKEKMDIIQTAGRDVIKSLLPVLDDFNRAKKAADDDDSIEAFSEGVQLVYEKLHNTMALQGLKAVNSNGEVFNADIHEAITEIPAPTEELKGKVIDTVESGYALNDKIIRFPKVVVGK